MPAARPRKCAKSDVIILSSKSHRRVSIRLLFGIVGAGGIGLQLSEQIRTYDFDQVAFIVLLILAAVALVDWISGKLRFAIIGRRQTLA